MDQDPEASHSEDALSLTDVPDICSIEEYNDVEAKQRASVLWLLSKAYMPKIPPELYEPCYRDYEGNDRLKPQIVHALANAELYCLALANIYADPNYHNLNHHGIIQVLMRKGIEINDPMDANLTETVLVQTAPIRMSAHMSVIDGIMALFIKEVLIPEKVMQVVNRFSVVNAESELPYDSEEAALLWINKSCIKLRHKMEEDLGTCRSPNSPDSSHLYRSHGPVIALAQDLGDLSDGCCLSAVLSLYCPRYFKWQDIHLNDPISLADSVHNLQLVQKFCQEHLPQDIYCLSLEDMVYMHPSILQNVLAFVADLMYIFEIRPPKYVCRPGVRSERSDNSKLGEMSYLNGQRQSPLQNCRIRSFQQAVSPIPDLRSGNYDVGRVSPRSGGNWPRPQKSLSARKIPLQDDKKLEGSRSLRRTHSVNFSEVNRHNELSLPSSEGLAPSHQRYHPEDDEELASYFPSKLQNSQSQNNLLDQEDNRRTRHSNPPAEHQPTPQPHYQVFHSDKNYYDATSPGHLESLSETNELSSGKWAEPREQPQKSGLQRSPSSYEIHQLSPSKQNVVKGRGYSCQRSQSDLHLSQDKRSASKQNLDTENVNQYQVQSVSHEHYTPRTFTKESRKSRNSFHESSDRSVGSGSGSTRRYSMDCGKWIGADGENQPSRQLSGSLTWRKPKDLFSRTDWNKENLESENNGIGDEQGSTVSFANLSKQRNNSGSAINIVYMHQDKDDQATTKKPAVRPGYLHINKSQTNLEGSSPTSTYSNTSDWVKNSDLKSQMASDASVVAQMHDIRMKLEEKRKRIEHEKALLEALSKKQREKMGKAAFMQAVKGGREDGYISNLNRQYSVDDITEDLDTVRRKWLEKKCAEQEQDNDGQSEDIQASIEQLNCSLSDLQTDISRLTEQQEIIQKMMKTGNPPAPKDTQSYYLHDPTSSHQAMPNKWAEPVNTYHNSNTMYPQQHVMPPEVPSHIGGRGHWGQPVIPFGGMQPQNIPMWQQQHATQPMRPASVEPQLMYGQPMPPMYDRPPSTVPFNQGFALHPQQQSNYGNYYTPNSYYQPENNPQQQYPYSPYQQSFPVMQNTFGRNSQVPNRNENAGFHLHRNRSMTYLASEELQNYSPHQDNGGNAEMPYKVQHSETMPLANSHSQHDIHTQSPIEEFFRAPRTAQQQHSPPNRPVLGKTFRVTKPKVTTPSSPNFIQPPPPPSTHHQTNAQQDMAEQIPQEQEDPTNKQELNDKGFYISFEEEPRKPKPKLKPKHLKARNQQKKLDSEARRTESSNYGSHVMNNMPSGTFNSNTFSRQQRESLKQECEAGDLRETSVDGSRDCVEKVPSSSVQSLPQAGVGFVVGSVVVEADPDKEMEMTRRKEMIMMMSMRRRAEQEAKKNEKQQEYLHKKEEERVKKEQIDRKKEEEKLRRQLILEEYRQRKAQEEEEGGGGGPTRGREESANRGATMTRSKSRSASVTRPRQRSGQTSNNRNPNLSSPSSLDSPVGRGSQYNLAGGYPDDVSSEHSYAPSPCRTRSYTHSSPISPTSFPPSPVLLGGGSRNRSTPSDGLSDSSSTVSSAWASEYTGPKLFVKPSTKSNRGIVTNAVNTVLAGAVNAETKRKVLEEIERSEGKHFLILFRDAGCQFRALYSYNPETEEVYKLYGIGPRAITHKMMDKYYKYNSGGKSFTQIHTKHLTATIDAFTIQNSLWQGKKNTAQAPMPKQQRDFY